MNMSLEAHVKEEDAKNRRNLKLFLDRAGNTYTRQALPMVWDYFELNPWSNATGDWNSALDWILHTLTHLTRIPGVEGG